jgi:hypothetical protein
VNGTPVHSGTATPPLKILFVQVYDKLAPSILPLKKAITPKIIPIEGVRSAWPDILCLNKKSLKSLIKLELWSGQAPCLKDHFSQKL